MASNPSHEPVASSPLFLSGVRVVARELRKRLGYAGAVMMALGLVLYLLLGAISLFWSVQPWLSYLEG